MKATKGILALAVAGLAFGAVAAPSVEVINIQQQYPWTNTVDITYTVQGVKDFPAKTATGGYASNETYFVTFEAKNGNNVLADVSGNTILTNALVEGNGTHVAQWQPALGQQVANCTATPSVFRGEDHAYLVINLETNAQGTCDWWFEPMSTQEASNERYNTDEYKTTKLVLRKISPGTYRIGHNGYLKGSSWSAGVNTPHDVVVPAGTCYFMGVFEVTRAQYARVLGRNPVSSMASQAGMSWLELRNAVSPGIALTPDPQNETSFFIRLAGLTGLPLDLPTDEMWEIAARAGATTAYPWGDSLDERYFWWRNNTNGAASKVGTRRPNVWGLYDVCGNVWEWCLDTFNKADLASKKTDIYTPVTEGDSSNRINKGGGNGTTDPACLNPSTRFNAWGSMNNANMTNGFRPSVIFRAAP